MYDSVSCTHHWASEMHAFGLLSTRAFWTLLCNRGSDTERRESIFRKSWLSARRWWRITKSIWIKTFNNNRKCRSTEAFVKYTDRGYFREGINWRDATCVLNNKPSYEQSRRGRSRIDSQPWRIIAISQKTVGSISSRIPSINMVPVTTLQNRSLWREAELLKFPPSHDCWNWISPRNWCSWLFKRHAWTFAT